MTATALHEYRLDREANEPLWRQLATVLRTAIADGVLQPDQALPSESELIDMYGVSRTVVREALAELVRRDLIYKIRAKGSFVAPRRPDLSFVGSTLGSAADLTSAGRLVTTQILLQAQGTATDHEARALRIEPESPVVRLRRMRAVDGSPWLLVDTTLPLHRFPRLLNSNLENRSLYDHLRRHYGVTVAGADRWLRAVIPAEPDAAILNLQPGEPALSIESLSWDELDDPFEYYRALHRSDEARFYVGIR
ncbi:GntR family transcriptional regulator [Nesterenkonia sp. YGD6]|uniref:GntR family transcriptional regulator n=1 Tax=Nesterenkonia sp. YGD6 TaxID=2901231 RepID=UPI001F4C9D9B|nr:GntR family transcriptional regulator [Nesterenkonia sp. YGD6]MCH8562892.1 GntR family transcriptional regulator [Nesterenkonia sp. YGD6]